MVIVTISRTVNPKEIVEVKAIVEALQALISSLPHRTLPSSVREKELPRRRVEAHLTESRSNRTQFSLLPKSVMSETMTMTAAKEAVVRILSAEVKAANRPNPVGVAAVATEMSTAAIQGAEIIKEVAVRVQLHTKSDQC